ncbi:MAG TPA: methylenetetrahydrofolate reductase C-terminal domain-containing protein [Vicinamibacterales bacterium]
MKALAERVKSGQFLYMTELVASGLKREAQVLEIASKLAMIPEIAAGSITSYAGGQLGQDSIRVGTAVRARGLVPNVHLTCVGQDRTTIDKTLAQLGALEMHNIFAISGDWPKAAARTAVFDIDSVQLAAHIAELRARTGTPYFISCAVSPFKYQREDCLYQYLKLEKKIAAGAEMAITQVGWDATKFVELKKYLDERGIKTPVLGNVYVLSRRAAERMNTGNPPGCWASDELVAILKKESEASDGGLQARLERGARSIAVLKGIGYAGAYIGGTHDANHIRWMIRRAEELAPKWQELYEELQFGKKDGFYLYQRDPQPKPARTFLPTVMDAAGKTLPFVPWAKTTKESSVKRVIAGAFRWLDRHPTLSHWFERFEFYSKKEVFGCQNCGNCVLGSMEYVCPQTCPKQMRNGPCGGTLHGACEVIDQECIWVKVMARAEASNTINQLKLFIPPPDRALTGTASWLNFYLGRDSRPGRSKDLWRSGGPGRTVEIDQDVKLQTAGPSAADQALAARQAKAAPAKAGGAGGAGKAGEAGKPAEKMRQAG